MYFFRIKSPEVKKKLRLKVSGRDIDFAIHTSTAEKVCTCSVEFSQVKQNIHIGFYRFKRKFCLENKHLGCAYFYRATIFPCDANCACVLLY